MVFIVFEIANRILHILYQNIYLISLVKVITPFGVQFGCNYCKITELVSPLCYYNSNSNIQIS